MSRTRQAGRLAAHLSEVTGVTVSLVYDSGSRWNMSWGDGPTRDQMRAYLTEALAGHHFPDMRDRQLHLHRGTSPRAWAARAIASRREGTLAPAVAEGAAWRRSHPSPYRLRDSDLTPEDHALLSHVEQLIEATAYPERASVPEDEPLIEQLLAAAGGRGASEYKMAPILLNADRAPSGEEPPQLRPVADKEQPMPPRISMDEQATEAAETATARFLQGLPGAREVTTTGELAAILARLPADTPLFLADPVAHPGTVEDPVHAVVAHLTACAEPSDPDDLDSMHRMRPALGLTTIRVGSGQDAGAEFERDGVEPSDKLARAENRLDSTGDLAGGIRDAADVVAMIAELLDAGTKFIPSDHDAHATVTVETSRLRHAAERLRKTAPDAQKASEQ
ncbi:hypothetical protein [Streptomyces chartreusis]|uniref:hypothetical protein n=1 Tax=Streptomyces chartreusis TaxID=1969 RepID=UPI003649ED3B